MFKYLSIKKYDAPMRRSLAKRFGTKVYYTPSEVRSTVYQKSFNEKYLPLAYMLYLSPNDVTNILEREFPHINIDQYQLEILDYIQEKQPQGFIHTQLMQFHLQNAM